MIYVFEQQPALHIRFVWFRPSCSTSDIWRKSDNSDWRAPGDVKLNTSDLQVLQDSAGKVLGASWHTRHHFVLVHNFYPDFGCRSLFLAMNINIPL